MRSLRSLFYLVISVTLLIYAMPRFHLNGIHTIEEGFALLWSFFALLVIGAHLYHWLDEDEAHRPNIPRGEQEEGRIRLLQR